MTLTTVHRDRVNLGGVRCVRLRLTASDDATDALVEEACRALAAEAIDDPKDEVALWVYRESRREHAMGTDLADWSYSHIGREFTKPIEDPETNALLGRQCA